MKTIKKLTLFIVISMLSLSGYALIDIDSIKMIPSSPTINDSITFQVYNSFVMSGCNLRTNQITINPPVITNTSQYCIGNYMGSCNTIDELKIPPLPYGSNVFYYSLETSYNSINPNCDTFFHEDSVEFAFNVRFPNGISEKLQTQDLFYVTVSENNQNIKILLSENHEPVYLFIYNLIGQTVLKTILINSDNELNTTSMGGLYFFCVFSHDKWQIKKIIIPNNH
jgi:hypothetical protein